MEVHAQAQEANAYQRTYEDVNRSSVRQRRPGTLASDQFLSYSHLATYYLVSSLDTVVRVTYMHIKLCKVQKQCNYKQ